MASKNTNLCIFLFFAYGIVSAKSSQITVGIDLGTTYSSVAIYRDAQLEVIQNDLGSRVTPLWVSFTDRECVIGEEAQNRSDLKPENTFFNVRRLLGRKFVDFNVQGGMKSLPYKIIDKDGKPCVGVKMRDGEMLVFSPEEISAMILQKMKDIAEAYLQQKVNKAVISVPACFNNKQRQAIRDACTIAGFHVDRIIDDPIAAVLAYGLDKAADKNILVFDLGGGKLEASLLSIEEEVIEILGTSCNTDMGGADFDKRVVVHFIELIKKKYNEDISQDQKALRELLKECERVKMVLSNQEQAIAQINSLRGSINLTEELTRAQFEELNMDLFQKAIMVVKTAIQKANLEKSDIHEILLVGSSTRIPKVQQILKDFFGGKDAVKGVNPDEAVAHGAAIQGDVLSQHHRFFPGVFGSAPMSLGIETAGGLMAVLIPRDTILPIKKSYNFTTYWDQQAALSIKVYAGERVLTKDCRELGRFDISGIKPARRGIPQIEVTFFIDVHITLYVTAKDMASKIMKSMHPLRRLFSNKEMFGNRSTAEKWAEEDEKIKRIVAQQKLHKCSNMQSPTGKNNATGMIQDNKDVNECLIQNILNDSFDGKEVMKGFNSDEAVDELRIGESRPEPLFIGSGYWTPYSLGIEAAGGLMALLIPRGRYTPAIVSRIFTTCQDQQTTVLIRVFEGERPLTKNCIELRRFELSGIGPSPRGVPQIEVTFFIDESMSLHVAAKDKATNISNSITVYGPNPSSRKEIEAKIQEAKKYAEEDKKNKERIEAQIRFETYFNMNTSCTSGDKLTGLILLEDEGKVVQQIFRSESQCPLTKETCEVSQPSFHDEL